MTITLKDIKATSVGESTIAYGVASKGHIVGREDWNNIGTEAVMVAAHLAHLLYPGRGV